MLIKRIKYRSVHLLILFGVIAINLSGINCLSQVQSDSIGEINKARLNTFLISTGVVYSPFWEIVYKSCPQIDTV